MQIDKSNEVPTILHKLFLFLSALRHGEGVEDKETILLAVDGTPSLASSGAFCSGMRVSRTQEGEQFAVA